MQEHMIRPKYFSSLKVFTFVVRLFRMLEWWWTNTRCEDKNSE